MDGFVLPAVNSPLLYPYSRTLFHNAHQPAHADSGLLHHSIKGDPLAGAGPKSSSSSVMLRTNTSGENLGFGLIRLSPATDPGNLKWSTAERLLQRAYNFHRELRSSGSGFPRESYPGNLAVGKSPLEDAHHHHHQLYARAAVLSGMVGVSDRTHLMRPAYGLSCGEHFLQAHDHRFQLGRRIIEATRLKREYCGYSSRDPSDSASPGARRPAQTKSRSNSAAAYPELKVTTEITACLMQRSQQKSLDCYNFYRQQGLSQKRQKLQALDTAKDSDLLSAIKESEAAATEGQLRARNEHAAPTVTACAGEVRSSPESEDSSVRPDTIAATSPPKPVHGTLSLTPTFSEEIPRQSPRENFRKLKPGQKRRERQHHRQRLASRDRGSDPSTLRGGGDPRGRQSLHQEEGNDRCAAPWPRDGTVENASCVVDHESDNGSGVEHEFEDDAAIIGDSRCGKTFTCSQCRYRTDRKNNLKRHVVTMHQKSTRVLECCGSLFHSKASLRDHVALFHRGGYRCQLCGRNFCRKALLRRHLTVHSGQKDFSCHLCGYATSHKSNLERHQRVHARKFSVTSPVIREPQPFGTRLATEEHAEGPDADIWERSERWDQGNAHEPFNVHRPFASRPFAERTERIVDLAETDNNSDPSGGNAAQRHEGRARESRGYERPDVPGHRLENEGNSPSFAEGPSGVLRSGENVSADPENSAYRTQSPSVTRPPSVRSEDETRFAEANSTGKPETPRATAPDSEDDDTQHQPHALSSWSRALSYESWAEEVASPQTETEAVTRKREDGEAGFGDTASQVFAGTDSSACAERLTRGHRSGSEFETLDASSPAADQQADLAEAEAEARGPSPQNFGRAREVPPARRALSRKSCFPNRLKETHASPEPLGTDAVSSVAKGASSSVSSQRATEASPRGGEDAACPEATKENRNPSENPGALPVDATAPATGAPPSPRGGGRETNRDADGDDEKGEESSGRFGVKVAGGQVHSKSRMCCRPYSCSGCGASFACQGALRSHVCGGRVGGDVLDFPLVSGLRKGFIKLSREGNGL